MAKTTNPGKPTNKQIHTTKKTILPPQNKQTQQQHLPSWAIMKNILTCKHLEVAQQQQQQQQQQTKHQTEKPTTQTQTSNKKSKKMKCYSSSLCNNTKVMHRHEPSNTSHEGSNRSFKTPLVLSEVRTNNTGSCVQMVTLGTANAANKPSNNNSNTGSNCVQRVTLRTANAANKPSNNTGSCAQRVTLGTGTGANKASNNGNYCVKGMGFRRLTGCYECRMIVDPVLAFTRDPSLRATICSCPNCGEIFMKPENLELHQAVRHAVSEMGADDTSKNIVEIIFQSSWLMKQNPVCKIDRILKVHNTQRTINKFEEYRDLIKFKANSLPKKHPRCIADGNELLRFYCTTFKCSLGINGSSNLCNSIPQCNICSIIKSGFKLLGGDGIGPGQNGILTTASSGRAHEKARLGPDENDKRAMLVCRVIAGRVKKPSEEGVLSVVVPGECDSVAGATGVYSNLDELYVFNTKAILPCFVVIYRGF